MPIGAVANSGTFNSNYPVKYNETDQVAVSLTKRIQELQSELDQLSQNKELSTEEKLTRKKDLETQIAELKRQLMQRNMDKRKEDSERKLEKLQQQAEKNAAKAETNQTQITTKAFDKVTSAQKSMGQINTMEKVKTKLEGEALCATDGSGYNEKINQLDSAIKQKATKLVEDLNQPTSEKNQKEPIKTKESEKTEEGTMSASPTDLDSTQEKGAMQNQDKDKKSGKEELPEDYRAIDILV